ncbi:MAG TPA: metalloregulator ArsR/SmtB family transcription factor [Chloroflexia bacterium]|nr:metalloregulator ArsR/SmtB family transcription factor [Chloroflexia bacterium]
MPDSLQNFKAEFFKALSHPIRIKIIEALRSGQKNVSELQTILGLDQSSVSQQLSVLRAKGLIVASKTKTNVFYTVKDPLLFDLLDVARAIFNQQLIDTRDLLSQLEVDDDSDKEKK